MIKDTTIIMWLIASLVVVSVSFSDITVSVIYVVMILALWIWWKSDKKIFLPFDRGIPWVKSLLKASLAYLLFLFISQVITGLDFQSIIGNIAAGTPVLKDSIILTVGTWVVFIAFIETMFICGRVYEQTSEMSQKPFGRFNYLNLRRINFKMIIMFILIGVVAIILHIVAKNLDSTALLLTFIFFVMSQIMVLMDRELKSAVLFHVINNGVAVFFILGYLKSVLPV